MSDAFAGRLIEWFDRHGRKDLPWQHNRTPYRVWVSEIMLQQTQVATVIPYYLRFMEAFPDVLTLATAPLDAVLRHWSGLGYYARARHLYMAAREIRDRHGGEFPEAFDDIVALPGIGRSTAGAIVALSRGEQRAILDGNAKRVLARFHAVPGWPGASGVARRLWEHAEAHTPAERTADYTQAIMDLGSTICTRTQPACARCPVASDCRAFATARVQEFPGKPAKKAKPLRHTHMVLAYCNGSLYLERRPPAGIWGGLWSLPEIEREDDVLDWCERRLDGNPVTVERWETLRHSFSHFDLDIRPLAVRLEGASRKLNEGDAGAWHSYREPPEVGLAAPVQKLIENLKAPRD